jgi:PAS domain S-box-containing protein
MEFFLSLNNDLTIFDWNSVSAELFSLDEKCIGKPIFDIVVCENEEYFSEVLTTGGSKSCVNVFTIKGIPLSFLINIQRTINGLAVWGKKVINIDNTPGDGKTNSEEILRNTEARIKAIFESLAEGVAFLDKNGRFIDANESALMLLENYQPDHKSFISPFPEHLRKKDGSLFQFEEIPAVIAFKSGKPVYNTEMGILQRNGSIKWISVNAQPVHDKQKNIIGAVTSFFDITDMKKTEETLAKERELLQVILDRIPVMITIYDPQVKSILVNKEFEKLSGWTQEEIDQGNIMEMAYPDPEYRNEVAGFMALALPEFRDIRMSISDGSQIDTMWANVKIPDGRQVGIGLDIRETKKIEEQLRENELRYRILAENLEVESGKLSAIIENLPVGIGLGDTLGRTLSLNKAGLEIHGFKTQDELIASLEYYQEHFQLLYTDGSEIPMEEWPVSKALRNEFVENYEVILHNIKTGIEKIISYSVVPVKNNEWEVVLLIYVLQDLTEKKEWEKALIESEQRFRTLADNIAPLVWMADNEGSIFWYNKRWYDYTGSTPDEMQGKGWTKVHDPDYLEKVLQKYNDSISAGTNWEDIFPLKGKDGNYRWFLSRALPVYNKEGKIVRWFGTNTDITEQKQLQSNLSEALDRLKENQARLLDAQKLASIGSLEIYPQTGIIEWSDAMFAIFNRDIKLGPPNVEESMRYIHPGDREKFKKAIMDAFTENRRVEIDFRVIRPYKRTKYLNIIVSPFRDESGNPVKILGAVMDITERKLSQLELEDAYKQIRERLHEKEILLKELYHRTKNNMQVISSLLGLKIANISDDTTVSVFEEMQSRIKAIALVHEKLYQSRNLSRVNLREYIIDLVNLLLMSHSVKKDKISFIHTLQDIHVLIDTAVPCGLVLTEIVLNSIKHAFPGERIGTIEIKLNRLENGSIELIIADNGVGADLSDLENEEKLGIKLFRNIAEGQLDAETKVYIENGIKWSIIFKDTLYNERI